MRVPLQTMYNYAVLLSSVTFYCRWLCEHDITTSSLIVEYLVRINDATNVHHTEPKNLKWYQLDTFEFSQIRNKFHLVTNGGKQTNLDTTISGKKYIGLSYSIHKDSFIKKYI